MSKQDKAIDRAMNFVQKALTELENEIQRHHAGEEKYGTSTQLGMFKKTLENMRDELQSNNVSFACGGMGRIIADSWPFDSELGKFLLQAEQSYFAIRETKLAK